MAEIKSALELALEKTKDVQGDRKTLEAHEHRQIGKRMLSKLQENSDFDPKSELKQYSGEHQQWVKEGLFEVLESQLSLPESEMELERVKKLKTGFAALIKDKKSLDYLFEQVEQLFSQYLQNRQQLIEQLRQRFQERVQQREQELSKQFGHSVKVDPSQDPEFSKTLQQNLSQLQSRYAPVIDQVREQLESMFQQSK